MTARALVLGVILLSMPVSTIRADAQPAPKTPVVGFLGSSEPGLPLIFSRPTEVFQQQLRELGWVDGRSVRIEWRWSERPERLADLAADLVRAKVDVIVASGSQATQASLGDVSDSRH
jgi:putative ABC transport system substrate-binding protein